MDFDEDKIDEFTLALLYLVTHVRKFIAKGELNELEEQGLIQAF